MPPPKPPIPRIFTVRGKRVLIDSDLAHAYGVTTKRFNEAFRRNAGRFPVDFEFQLTGREFAVLRSQIATLDKGHSDSLAGARVRNGGATGPRPGGRGTHRKYLPWVFTEHGAVMAANVLRSPRAVAMSVFVVRAFVRMREHLMTGAVILRRLAEIDKTLLEHDTALRTLWSRLRPLLAPPPERPAKEMGFHTQMQKPSRRSGTA